eukprot:g13439.t1
MPTYQELEQYEIGAHEKLWVRWLLLRLYRQSKQTRVADFLSNDLSEEPWRTKAEKNAFELVRQRRFELGCAFFIFAQRAKDAIDSLRRPAMDGRCPAHWAALSGQVAILELLQGLVPDTLRAKARNGATPAHDAAFQGQLAILQLLHELAPSTLRAKSNIGATPAHDAAFGGQVETLLLLHQLADEVERSDQETRCGGGESKEETVCVRYMDDWSLALFIAHSSLGDQADQVAEELRRVLTDDLLPVAKRAQDPWLASLVQWHLGDHQQALNSVARPVSQEDVQSDMPGALDWLVECVQQVLWS